MSCRRTKGIEGICLVGSALGVLLCFWGGCSRNRESGEGKAGRPAKSTTQPSRPAQTPKQALQFILALDTRNQRRAQHEYIHLGPSDPELHDAMYEYGRAARDFYALYVRTYGMEDVAAPPLWMVSPELVEKDFLCEIDGDKATGWLRGRREAPFGLMKFTKIGDSWRLDLSHEVPSGEAREGFLKTYRSGVQAFHELTGRIRAGDRDGKAILRELHERLGLPLPASVTVKRESELKPGAPASAAKPVDGGKTDAQWQTSVKAFGRKLGQVLADSKPLTEADTKKLLAPNYIQFHNQDKVLIWIADVSNTPGRSQAKVDRVFGGKKVVWDLTVEEVSENGRRIRFVLGNSPLGPGQEVLISARLAAAAKPPLKASDEVRVSAALPVFFNTQNRDAGIEILEGVGPNEGKRTVIVTLTDATATLIGGPSSTPARQIFEDDPVQTVAKKGKFWLNASEAKQGDRTITPGGRIWIWPAEDRLYKGKSVRKRLTLPGQEAKRNATIPVRLHWMLRSGQKPPNPSTDKWTGLCWWYGTTGKSHWHCQDISLPQGKDRGTLTADIGIEGSSGKTDVILFVRMGEKFLLSPVASNLLVIQVEIGEGE